MSSSTKIDNRKKDILILGKGPTQGIEHMLSAEKCIRLIIQSRIKSSLRGFIIMEQTVFLLANGKEIHKFKAKDSEIVATPLCPGNISKGWSVDNMKKIGFNGHVYNFSVDYNPVLTTGIPHIHKYMMTQNGIV